MTKAEKAVVNAAIRWKRAWRAVGIVTVEDFKGLDQVDASLGRAVIKLLAQRRKKGRK